MADLQMGIEKSDEHLDCFQVQSDTRNISINLAIMWKAFNFRSRTPEKYFSLMGSKNHWVEHKCGQQREYL